MTKQLSSTAAALSAELNPNASRLRDNQRRSRARKKEYLASLEAKVAECQRTGVEASIEIQSAARAVVKENLRLKELLRKVGLTDSEIEAWVVEGGLDPHALERVQRGLGPRQCGGVDRPAMVRRGSTGGLPTGKVVVGEGGRPSPQRRASMMPNQSNNTNVRSPPLRPVPGVSSPLAQPELRVFTMYPTHSSSSSTTAPSASSIMTPTSATPTSPYAHPSLGSPFFSTSATSPPILPGAIAGWNNFPINPSLPPPAMPHTVLNDYVAAQQQRQAQAASQAAARAFYTSGGGGDGAIPRGGTTSCQVASEIIGQYHASGYAPEEMMEEICPPRNQQFQGFGGGGQQGKCCGGVISCGGDSEDEEEDTASSVGSGVAGMDLGSQRGLVRHCGGQGQGQQMDDAGMGGCEVDNVVLFNVLGRIA